MPDVTPDVSHSPSPSNGAASAEVDPFLKLHKMSTTAGLGSGEYVAINGTAVTSVLLGIASSLVLFGLTLLLLIPLAGVVCAMLALRQVSNSNGTQTGRVLAGIGLLLSLGFGGTYVGRQAIESVRNRSDEQQIAVIINQMQSDIKSEKYADIYDLTDEQFRKRIPQNLLAERFRMYNSSMIVGKVTGLESKLLKFENDQVTEERVGSGLVLVAFEKAANPDRQGMVFRKINDKWMLDDLPSLFPPERQGPGGPGAPGGAGGGGGAPSGQPVIVPATPQGPQAPK